MMKKEKIKRGWLLGLVFLLFISGFFLIYYGDGILTGGGVLEIQNAGMSTSCGGIQTTITLLQNVSSPGTCYTINASNIELNCAGNRINYSFIGNGGYGVNVSGFTNVTIRNCIIVEGTDNGTAQHGILLDGNASTISDHISIVNTTITVQGTLSQALAIRNFVNHTNISSVIITVSGGNGSGISLANAHHNLIYYSEINTTGSAARGIVLTTSSNNTLFANTIRTVSGYSLELSDAGVNNTKIYNNTLLSTINFTIMDLSEATTTNQLIYEATFGFINWSKANLTSNMNLTLSAAGQVERATIIILNGTIGLAAGPALELVDTARIRMTGLFYPTVPQLLKAGSTCGSPLCNITYDSSNGILDANITSFSNYTLAAVNCTMINTSTTLTQDVTVDGTCFTIGAPHIVLNCADYEINYSYGGTYGHGVLNAAGHDNVTIRNCLIKEGSSITEGKNAINLSNSSIANILFNNRIITTGVRSFGISIFESSNNSNISRNNITIWGPQGIGVRLLQSHHAIFLRNQITANATPSDGLVVETSENNTYQSENIRVLNGYGIYLVNAGVINNIFYGPTILADAINFTILDLSGSATTNEIIFNESGGMINWTLTNLTTQLNISLGLNISAGHTVFIDSVVVGLIDSPLALNLNGTAKLKFYGLTYASQGDVRLLKSGVRCDNTIFCNMTYNATTGVLEVNVSSFSNYTHETATSESAAAATAEGSSSKIVLPSPLPVPAAEAMAAAEQYSPTEPVPVAILASFQEILDSIQKEKIFVTAQISASPGLEQPSAGKALAAVEKPLTLEKELLITITNNADKPLALTPRVEIIPVLPNVDNVRVLLLKKIAAEPFSTNVEELVNEKIILFSQIEAENLKSLVAKRFTFSSLKKKKESIRSSAPTGTESVDLTESGSEVIPSVNSIALTRNTVVGRLLLPVLEKEEELIVQPGETLEKWIKIKVGLSARSLKVIFMAGGEKVFERELKREPAVYGSAIDVDPTHDLLDLYVVLPASTPEKYSVEVTIIKPRRALLTGELSFKSSLVEVGERWLERWRSRQKILYLELFGPYAVGATTDGIILGQQLQYDPYLYYGPHLVRMRLFRGSELVADQTYPVQLD